MTRYRRALIPGGTFFFTVTLADRRSDLLLRHIAELRRAYATAQQLYPFETVAICVLPDHLHAIWTLPDGDSNFPLRWRIIKSGFSRKSAAMPRSRSKSVRREKGIWQRRYWEHLIRNEEDFDRHIDYVHFNPVSHGFVSCVRDWPYSSFRRYVAGGFLPADWGGDIREIAGRFGE